MVIFGGSAIGNLKCHADSNACDRYVTLRYHSILGVEKDNPFNSLRSSPAFLGLYRCPSCKYCMHINSFCKQVHNYVSVLNVLSVQFDMVSCIESVDKQVSSRPFLSPLHSLVVPLVLQPLRLSYLP